MSDAIRDFRNLGIYLLPIFLLAITGVLLMALLYGPDPTVAMDESRTSEMDQERQAHAKNLLDAMLTDALRELESEQATGARTLMYRHERNPLSAERPTLPWISPLFSDNTEDGFKRSRLIQL